MKLTSFPTPISQNGSFPIFQPGGVITFPGCRYETFAINWCSFFLASSAYATLPLLVYNEEMVFSRTYTIAIAESSLLPKIKFRRGFAVLVRVSPIKYSSGFQTCSAAVVGDEERVQISIAFLRESRKRDGAL